MKEATQSGLAAPQATKPGNLEVANRTVRELSEYLSHDPIGQLVLKLSKVKHLKLNIFSEEDQLSLLELALKVRQLKALI